MDIQSYIHDEKKMGEEILQFSTSRVRLNIGTLSIHSLQERLNSLHNSSQKESSSSDPRVLEVLGYVTAEKEARHRARTLARESKPVSKMSKVFNAVRKLPGALHLHVSSQLTTKGFHKAPFLVRMRLLPPLGFTCFRL